MAATTRDQPARMLHPRSGRVRGHGQRLGFRPGRAPGCWALGLLAFGVLFASAVALVAVLRQGERSLPVLALCLFAGLGVVYFLFGELALPH